MDLQFIYNENIKSFDLTSLDVSCVLIKNPAALFEPIRIF